MKNIEKEIFTQKLNNLYTQVLQELASIGIDMKNKDIVGDIDIKISTRSTKRYGCCKQGNPDKQYKVVEKLGRRNSIRYEKFKTHHIEISKWVLDLNDEIIKNTIIHELIHCIPFCNNHGEEFKKYANYINEKLGYNIKARGNKKEDYEKSNLTYIENEKYSYKIICEGCRQVIYRKRLNTKLLKRYRCGKCGGKLKLLEENHQGIKKEEL